MTKYPSLNRPGRTASDQAGVVPTPGSGAPSSLVSWVCRHCQRGLSDAPQAGTSGIYTSEETCHGDTRLSQLTDTPIPFIVAMSGGSPARSAEREGMDVVEQERNSRHRFTLVELLVVVLIIAILAALLLPMLARSRAKAAQADCLNNLRNLSLASRLYMEDHNGVYAPGHSIRQFFRFWIEDISPYLQEKDMTECPSDKQKYVRYWWQAGDGRRFKLLYNVNFLNGVLWRAPSIRHQELEDPQGTIEFADGHGGCIHMIYLHTDANPTANSGHIKLQFRHKGWLNAIHFDGHAAPFQRTKPEWWTYEAD